MEKDIELFRELIAQATATIAADYFLLPVADAEGGEPILEYRERVYAYELYHQLRCIWPKDWRYSLAGEVDKRNHPLVRGADLDNTKPDILAHVPGVWDGNLAVLEIKPLRDQPNTGERESFQRDLHKLRAYRAIGYASSFFLVFGERAEDALRYGRELRDAGIEVSAELFHHARAGESAKRLEW